MQTAWKGTRHIASLQLMVLTSVITAREAGQEKSSREGKHLRRIGTSLLPFHCHPNWLGKSAVLYRLRKVRFLVHSVPEWSGPWRVAGPQVCDRELWFQLGRQSWPNTIPHSLAGKAICNKPDHVSHFLSLFLCSNICKSFWIWERRQQQPF